MIRVLTRVVLLFVRTLTAVAVFQVNPALLRERATVLIHRQQPLMDRLILFAFMGTALIGVPAVAAPDVFHWHLLPSPPRTLGWAGLLLFVIEWTIIAVALRANTFAVTVVRLQHERQQNRLLPGIW